LSDLRKGIMNGTARRLPPKSRTFATNLPRLLSIMWLTGTGSDVMNCSSAPMVNGVFSHFLFGWSILQLVSSGVKKGYRSLLLSMKELDALYVWGCGCGWPILSYSLQLTQQPYAAIMWYSAPCSRY
jgi:hypothetical protein